ncbi:MAG: alpha/beta fold hydrolase, partial [Thermoanaerobaculia bacterium]
MFTPAPELPEFLERQLPFHRRIWRVEEGADTGRSVHFIDQGDEYAPTILMLHGNPAWSFLWRKVIAALPEFRCVAPDLLGLGLSDTLPRMDDHTPTRHADAIAGLVVALDLRGIIILSQDWGGPIATSVAARLPDRIAGILLGNTSVLTPSRGLRSRFHR